MKYSKLKNVWYSISLIILLVSCNYHTNTNQTTGSKSPVTVKPEKSGSGAPAKVISPNEEYDQHKIDSIKMNKKKGR